MEFAEIPKGNEHCYGLVAHMPINSPLVFKAPHTRMCNLSLTHTPHPEFLAF